MKIKMVNKRKCIRSLIFITMLLILTLLGINSTYSKTKIVYKEDYIIKGDTLWDIAENEVNTNQYYKNRDIRDVMYELKKINHLSNENLEIGKKIFIPNIVN